MSVNKNGYKPVWNLYSTLIISFIIFVTFTLAQSIILFLIQKIHSDQAVDLNSLAYNYLGVISFFLQYVDVFACIFLSKLKTLNLKSI